MNAQEAHTTTTLAAGWEACNREWAKRGLTPDFPNPYLAVPAEPTTPEMKTCVECGRPARGYSSYCSACHFEAFEGGADIG